MRIRRRPATFLALLAALACGPALAAAQGIPARLSDSAYWGMITEFSEVGGYFRSDNFVSNELQFQYVIPELQRTFGTGGVYIGVGPDQNFTYVVALKPKIAFIVDIRRQAMLQHLMYKALIETSADRAEFLSKLFSRPQPADLTAASTAEDLFGAYFAVAASPALYEKNRAAIRDHLTKTHGFALSPEDLQGIDYVYSAFYRAGPSITYNTTPANAPAAGGFSRRGGGGMPTYSTLQIVTDAAGTNRSYTASEENFRVLKDLHTRNLFVPLVGNFAGDKTVRAVGKYLTEHGALVSAFYTSNVEQYLFQQGDDWSRFYTNVATLPIDEKSTFIRSLAGGRGGQATSGRTSLLCPIGGLIKAFREGRVRTYADVIGMSR